MSRKKRKGRQPSGAWYWIPKQVHRSADFKELSPHALKLLCSLAYQLNGFNNGDLTAAWTVMSEQHGFKSEATLNRCKKELLAANLIYLTRQGGLGRCSLYALTWMPIDDCNGKFDCQPTTMPIRREWHQEKLTTPKTKRMKESTVIEFAQRKEQLKR
jgi:hypothetical protein